MNVNFILLSLLQLLLLINVFPPTTLSNASVLSFKQDARKFAFNFGKFYAYKTEVTDVLSLKEDIFRLIKSCLVDDSLSRIAYYAFYSSIGVPCKY